MCCNGFTRQSYKLFFRMRYSGIGCKELFSNKISTDKEGGAISEISVNRCRNRAGKFLNRCNFGAVLTTKKRKSLKINGLRSKKVSKMRVELTRPIGHYPLKVARLPIPPPGQKESERRDSDPRPRPWQGRALPTELLSQSKYCFQYRTIVKFKER